MGGVSLGGGDAAPLGLLALGGAPLELMDGMDSMDSMDRGNGVAVRLGAARG